MTDTIRTQHPRCPTCKCRLNIDGRCLHCRPYAHAPQPWNRATILMCTAIVAACVWLIASGRAAAAILAALALLGGCAPTLQVAQWRPEAGPEAATIRCTANGRTAAVELASDTTITVRAPTPEAQP